MTSSDASIGTGATAACLAAGSVGLLILGVQPVLLAPLVIEGRLAESGVGNLVTIEVLAIAAGSLLGLRLLRHLRAAIVLVVGAVLLALADAGMTGQAGGVLFLLRAVAGLAAGMLVALPLVAIARGAKPERLSALFLAAQTLLQLAVAAVMPALSWAGSRADAGFLILAGTGVATLLLVPAIPTRLAPAAAEAERGAVTAASAAGLLAAGVYLGGIVSVWSYLGLWLGRHGHPPSVESAAVSISLAFQVLGALVAARVSDRLSNRGVIMAAAIGEAGLVAILLWGSRSPTVVYAVSAAFGFLWLFALPSFTGLLIEVDPARRAVLYIAAAQLAGSAALPSVAALFVTPSDIGGAFRFGLAAFALAVVLTSIRFGGARLVQRRN